VALGDNCNSARGALTEALGSKGNSNVQQLFHARTFNIFARCFGIGITTVGVVFIVTALYYWQNPEATLGISAPSGSPALEYTVVAAICFVVGFLFLTVRAYRPDLVSKEQLNTSPKIRQTWWTGELKN
jgi:hypothetical protein